ncbi:hypothetical protein [Paenalcaligenes suwonensis]|uniref:hypothetical protein n=1 Tax=Paenalcaligenes suwonensis TaxID=1202713 RepID=UPI001407F19B|nr:hypothetical protein [Paenalcaligenes suwonensis]NHC62515.1 hypothetical protein [Paenalcaligenes suwonensis]
MSEENKLEFFKIQISMWEKVVDVQMHFNDLCLRIRSFSISILGVLLGAAAIAYRFAGYVSILDYKIPTASIFMTISVIVWLAFYLMDRFWYHELLKGAVHHAQKIEESLKKFTPEIELANSIREQSHKSLKMNAAKKLNIFYLSILVVQLLALVSLSTDIVKISG